jgi:aquaporin Z
LPTNFDRFSARPDWALAQLWLFWLAPLVGGTAGGILYRWLSEEPAAQVTGFPMSATR